jgi:LPS-assembly protein
MSERQGRDRSFPRVPILYSPWLSFALNDERKSGFLMPSYGSSNNSGFDDFGAVLLEHRAEHGRDLRTPVAHETRRCSSAASFAISTRPYGGFYNSSATVEYLPNDREAALTAGGWP